MDENTEERKTDIYRDRYLEILRERKTLQEQVIAANAKVELLEKLFLLTLPKQKED